MAPGILLPNRINYTVFFDCSSYGRAIPMCFIRGAAKSPRKVLNLPFNDPHQTLVDTLREAVLAQHVVHAAEAPVLMIAPAVKKTHRKCG